MRSFATFFWRLSVLLSLTLLTAFMAFAQKTSYWGSEALHESHACLLNLVRTKMEIKPFNAPMAQLRLSSETPLTEYQAAVESWWKARPEKFTNLYHRPLNTIFLSNDLNLYSDPRTPMDSLVHELAHYVQKQSGRRDGMDEDFMETEAVQIQDWFRDQRGQFIKDQKYEGPCE